MDLNKENDFYDTLDEETEKVLNNFLKKYDLTEEEKEQKRKEAAIELEKKGFLPKNEEFHSEVPQSQETVEQNPRRYIIEECIPACQELWSKNIYTYIVSDHEDKFCQIQLCFLSEENRKIAMSISGSNEFKANHATIYVNYFGKKAQDDLLKLAKQFKMQDVQEHDAYISVKDFLIDYCNCYDEIPNPDYIHMDPPDELESKLRGFTREYVDYLDKYDKWKKSIHSKKTLKKLNRNKITKPIDELVKEHGMILDDDRVYLSQFHYNKHLNYLNWLENENTNESIIRHK